MRYVSSGDRLPSIASAKSYSLSYSLVIVLGSARAGKGHRVANPKGNEVEEVEGSFRVGALRAATIVRAGITLRRECR